jgi:hypothetical protein
MMNATRTAMNATSAVTGRRDSSQRCRWAEVTTTRGVAWKQPGMASPIFIRRQFTEVSGHSGKLIARYNKLLATLWHSCTQASATRLLAKLKFERSTSG